MMRRIDLSSLLAAALVAASAGIGTWKVVEVRRENERLALQATTCIARNEAFLSVLRTARDNRRERSAVGPVP